MAKRSKLAYNQDQLTQNLQESTGKGVGAFFSSPTRSPEIETPKTDQPNPNTLTSDNDVTTSDSDVTTSSQLDSHKLTTIIRSIAQIPASAQNTPVRLSVQEKQDIDDFIHITLRQANLTGNAVSASKLLRYSLRYLMKVHDKEFIEALQVALKRDTELPI